MSTCRKYDTADLTVLAAGDLSAVAAWRLRRHLSVCQECRSEWESIMNLFAGAARCTTSPPGQALAGAVWARVSVSPAPSRPAPLQRRVAIGTLGVITASALALGAFALLPGTPTNPTVAFARVEEALGDIHTVTWRETSLHSAVFYPDGRYQRRSARRSWTMWARFDAPAVAQVFRSGLRTVAFADEKFQIHADKHGLYYSRYDWGIPDTEVFGSVGGASAARRVRSAVLFEKQALESKARWQGRLGDKVKTAVRSPWVSREVRLDGRRVLRLESTLRYEKPLIRNADGGVPWRETGTTWVFWVEPDSYRILRREVKTRVSGGRNEVELTHVSDAFRYNATPPAGVFEVTPPVGARYRFVPLPQRPATPAERSQIEAVVRRALDAWNRRDATAYADFWDFEYDAHNDPTRPNRLRRQQVRYLEAGAPYRTWGPTRLLEAKGRISAEFVHAAGAPFPPREPGEFTAAFEMEGQEQGGKTSRERVTLNLRRGQDGEFRLIRDHIAGILESRRIISAIRSSGAPTGRITRREKPSGTAPRPAGRR